MKRRLAENIFFYFCGFFFVLIFLVIALAVSYTSLDRSVRYSVDQEFDRNIENLEDIFERVRMLNNIIVQDSSFTTLVYHRGNESSSVGTLKTLNEFFRRLSFVSNDVEYIFSLYSLSDIYLSSGDTSVDFDDYYSKFLNVVYEGERIKSGEDFRNLLRQSFSKGWRYLRLDSFSYYSGGRMYSLDEPLLILQSASDYSLSPLFLTGYLIAKETLANTLAFAPASELGEVRIYDEHSGSCLLSTTDENFDDGWYVFARYTPLLDFTITLALPFSYLAGQLSTIMTVLCFVLAGALISALVFAFYYGFRRYAGFSSLLAAFEGDSEDINRGRGKDYEAIYDRIVHLRKAGDSYRELASEVERRNRAIQFENIITKGIKTEEEKTFIDSIVTFATQGYALAIVRLFSKGDELLLSLYDYLEESAFPHYLSVHSGSSDEILVFETGEMSVDELLSCLSSYLKCQENLVIHIGISPRSTDSGQISECCEKAFRALASLYVYENESAIVAYEAEKRVSLQDSFNVESLARVRNFLLGGQRAAVKDYLDSLFEKMETSPLEGEERKSEIYHLLLNVYQDAAETLLHPPLSSASYSNDLTMNQIRDLFLSYTDELCSFADERRKSHNIRLRDRVMAIIEDEYSNSALSAYSVSRRAGISEKYLQNFFRDQMKISFSQYLLLFRLEKAKALLETTELQNEKIAELTGFGAVNTFYRNFSRHFGLSPKAYREGRR